MRCGRHFTRISNDEVVDVIVINDIRDITGCLIHLALATILFCISNQWLFLLVLLSLDKVILLFCDFGFLRGNDRCWLLFLF